MRARARGGGAQGPNGASKESLILFVIFRPKGLAPRAAEGAFPSNARGARRTSVSL
jgi:hypothetical protein